MGSDYALLHGFPLTPDLIQKYSSLITRVARRIKREHPNWHSYPLDDMVSDGWIGLMQVLSRRDDAKGNFDAYAAQRIRGIIFDGARRLDLLKRHQRDSVKEYEEAVWRLSQGLRREPYEHEIREALGWSEEKLATVEQDSRLECLSMEQMEEKGVPLDILDTKDTGFMPDELFLELRRAIGALDERQRQIIYLHYFEGWKQKDIANQLGISEPTISQQIKRILNSLEKRLRPYYD